MKERGMIFDGESVLAILDGRKTQTRRVFTLRTSDGTRAAITHPDEEIVNLGTTEDPEWAYKSTGGLSGPYPAPGGKPGDRIWVKETWAWPVAVDDQTPKKLAASCLDAGWERPWCPTRYAATPDLKTWASNELSAFMPRGVWGRWRSPLFMPRWASRLLLEIEDVRVQRVQEVSEDDARAEGVEKPERLGQLAFASRWNAINAKRGYSWESNPWVWAYTFRVDA